MKPRTYLLLAAAAVYVSATALHQAFSAELIRDEHQFLAGAYLIAERGLQPYRDFASFHMPNLLYLQGGLFALTDYPFLAARTFSALCSIGIVVLLFVAANSLAPEGRSERWVVVSLGCAVLFANSELFMAAAGYVWNHAPSALASLLAFMLHRRAIRRGLSWRLAGLSGLALGVAIGVRLSASPLILPFLAALLLQPSQTARAKRLAVVAFGLGGLLGNLPALLALGTSPHAFIFGNLGYPRLNTLYRSELGFDVGMSVPGKLELAIKEVHAKPAELLLLVAAAYSLLGLGRSGWRQIWRTEFALLLALVPFAYLGALAPTPAFQQYFIAPFVFLTLIAPYGLARLESPELRRAGAWLLSICALVSCLYGGFPKSVSALRTLLQPETWAPLRLHAHSEALAAAIGEVGSAGQVLTLAPIYAVEGGVPIFPEFATGAFGWRVSHLMSPADRARFRLASPADLGELLRRSPPAALLTGSPDDRHLEGPLTQAARRIGFGEQVLTEDLVLWVP